MFRAPMNPIEYAVQQLQHELRFAEARVDEKKLQIEQWGKTHLNPDSLKSELKTLEKAAADKQAELDRFVNAQKSLETGKKVGHPDPKPVVHVTPDPSEKAPKPAPPPPVEKKK